MRRAFRDGRIQDPDVQLAIQTKNAFLLIGGYRSLGRNPTPRIRTEVRERDGGRCQQCGKPGLEVDHIAGSSDDLDNLQLLCLDCHHAKTAENMEPAGPEDREALRGMFETRVVPDEPQLLADDELGWSGIWRGLQSARKERFLHQLRAAGLPVRRNDSHATRVLAYLDATEPADTAMTAAHDFGEDAFFDEVMKRNAGSGFA